MKPFRTAPVASAGVVTTDVITAGVATIGVNRRASDCGYIDNGPSVAATGAATAGDPRQDRVKDLAGAAPTRGVLLDALERR